MTIRFFILAAAAAASGLLPAAATAQPSCAQVDRSTVVRCALATSAEVRASLATERGAEARVQAARPVLPSNPTLSGSVASRQGSTESAINYYVTLSQELEVAGQRGLRIDESDATLRLRHEELAATRSAEIARAWAGYFKALAAKERHALAVTLEGDTKAVLDTVHGMQAGGLAAGLDEDLAEAALIDAMRARLQLEAAARTQLAELALLVNGSDLVTVDGELMPLSVGASAAELPQVRAAQARVQALAGRAALLRRQRVPNPTLSLFAQNDGFNERVLGGGISLPIPLPQPVGRTLAGEIAEAQAEAERADAELLRQRRAASLQLIAAQADFDAAERARALYPPERIGRLRQRLSAIAEQVRAGRLGVRDALMSRQTLVNQLQAAVDVREGLCLASVRLAHAKGNLFDGDVP